jgi:hypothetical protein
MKTKTKKVIKFALLIALLTGAFLIGSNQGYKKGQNDVIKNQIITNNKHDKGFYFSDYKGQINKYWYE